jgi:hypothetical protein
MLILIYANQLDAIDCHCEVDNHVEAVFVLPILSLLRIFQKKPPLFSIDALTHNAIHISIYTLSYHIKGALYYALVVPANTFSRGALPMVCSHEVHIG